MLKFKLSDIRSNHSSKHFVQKRSAALIGFALLSLFGQAEATDLPEILSNGIEFSGPDANGWVEITSDGNADNDPKYNLIALSGNQSATIEENLRIDQQPLISQSQFSIQATDGSSLNLTGKLDFKVTASEILPVGFDKGTYALYANNKGELNITGEYISVEIRHDLPPDDQLGAIGANLIYLQNQSRAVIGQAGGTTRLWAIAGQPDLISAKRGSSIEFKSTHNQLVGSIDMMDAAEAAYTGNKPENNPNSISITLSGPDSYWFGDEKTWQNSTWTAGASAGDAFNLTLEDGAQWSYLSLPYVRNQTYWALPKRISKITLNGGIINLFDQNLQDVWTEIGLWDAMQNGDYNYEKHPEYKHNYLVVGDLQGSGGIFRMDLNAEKKTESDMLYIEGGSGPDNATGMHYFEPYQLHLLKSITPENTLTFALVKKDANIGFVAKENLDGDGLWNYELDIANEEITAEAIEANKADWERETTLTHVENPDDPKETPKTETFTVNLNEYEGGQNWYIYRVTLHESEAVQGMSGAGWASYGAAIEMDRRDRRLSETVRNAEDPNNGLWIRVHHGRSGASNQYRWYRTGVTLGFERDLSANNAVGAWFGYTEGDTDLLDVDGSGEMKRYELALYDTLTIGSSYFDFVGRIGRVSSEVSASGNTYGTSGDFDQDYAALSAEYGYTLKDESTGIFFEPQVQLQAAYLDSYDYRVQRGIRIEADNDVSVIGRVGLRTGKTLRGENLLGEVYLRGDVLHQFTDGQDAAFRAPQDEIRKTWGDFGTWCDFGVGSYLNWKNTVSLQFDVERTAGGETDSTWLISGRFSYLF